MLGEEKLEFISEWFVKPKHKIDVANERIYLKALEICMLGIHPIQKGLLFTLNQPTHNKDNLFNLINNLKSSLSVALVHFYPLAGQFANETFPDERACTVFIDCNKGQGARLIHAVAPNVTVSDIVSPICVPEIVLNFFDFGQRYVNYDGHTRPLLSIQVTELVDGIFLGFSISHSVVDGTSFMHFVKMLSELFFDVDNNINVDGISRVPIFDHSSSLKLPYHGLDENMSCRDNGPLMDRIFHFSHVSLAALKTKANQCCGNMNISSFQALASLVWKSITKARNLSTDEETSCCLVTNARSRLDPPLSDDYFGDYVSQVKVICKVGELLSNDLGWASMLLNDGIKAKSNESIRGVWNKLLDVVTTVGFPCLVGDIHGQNNVVIGGSTRFDMYEAEFGLGKAVAVRTGYGNKDDGKVTANQASQGIGNVDLEISLTPHNMASLVADHDFMKFVTS